MILLGDSSGLDTQTLKNAIQIADLVGVLFNAVLGGVIARAEKFDPVGFVVLAIMSGLGGGIIRDTLLQKGPPAALTDTTYIAVALVGALIAFAVPINQRLWDTTFVWIDAIAVGAWAAAGAQKALSFDFGWISVIMLGTITAVGGGLARDVVLGRVPAIFGGNTLYATPAILSSATMVGMWHVGYPNSGAVVAIAVGAGLMLLASWRGWVLPGAYEWGSTRPPGQGLPRPGMTSLRNRLRRRRR